jgi:hypothetical protein
MGEPKPTFTEDQRVHALDALERSTHERFAGVLFPAEVQFRGHLLDHLDQLDDDDLLLSDELFAAWFGLDRRFAGGRTGAEVLLTEPGDLDPGALRWVAAARDSGVHLFEVVDVARGRSVTLVDAILQGPPLVLADRELSQALGVGYGFAVRVLVSGELEPPGMPLPPFALGSAVEALAAWREAQPGQGEDLWRATAPLLHDVWARCTLGLPLDTFQNTDGDDVLLTTARFAVRDRSALQAALDEAFLPGGDGTWLWLRADEEAAELGRLGFDGADLVLCCNSPARAARGQALVEQSAGSAVRFVGSDSTELSVHLRRG